MPTSFNFVLDAKLAQGSYKSNNKENTAVIDGWQPVAVDLKGYQPPTTFGANSTKARTGSTSWRFVARKAPSPTGLTTVCGVRTNGALNGRQRRGSPLRP